MGSYLVSSRPQICETVQSSMVRVARSFHQEGQLSNSLHACLLLLLLFSCFFNYSLHLVLCYGGQSMRVSMLLLSMVGFIFHICECESFVFASLFWVHPPTMFLVHLCGYECFCFCRFHLCTRCVESMSRALYNFAFFFGSFISSLGLSMCACIVLHFDFSINVFLTMRFAFLFCVRLPLLYGASHLLVYVCLFV